MSPRARKRKSREKLKQKPASRTLQQAEKLSPRSRKRKSRENLQQKTIQELQQANIMAEEELPLEDMLEGLQITGSKKLGKRRVAEGRRGSQEGILGEQREEEERLSTGGTNGKYYILSHHHYILLFL